MGDREHSGDWAAAMERVRLELDAERRAARIVLEEAVDVSVAAPVEQLLLQAVEAGVERVELDFANVSFADSTAVRLAMKAHHHLVSKDKQVVIKAPPSVRRLFDMTGTASLFEILPTT
jgi:anti-anti-sigma factor